MDLGRFMVDNGSFRSYQGLSASLPRGPMVNSRRFLPDPQYVCRSKLDNTS